MKKILLVTLSILMLTTGIITATGSTLLSETPPHSDGFPDWNRRVFQTVGELMQFIENPRSHERGLLTDLAQQQGRIITADVISDEFEFSVIRTIIDEAAISYHFRNEKNDEIIIRVFLAGIGGRNMPLGEALADVVSERPNSELLQTRQSISVQYTTLSEEIQIENTDLYYAMISPGIGQRVYIEISGTHIIVDFIIRDAEHPFASLRANWDNSYLDLINFTLHPVNITTLPSDTGNNGNIYVPVEPDLPWLSPSEINVVFNGVRVPLDVPAIIVNDRTMIPFRTIFYRFEMDVEWDDYTRTAIGEKENLRIELPIGSYTAFVNGEAVKVDSPAIIYEGRTMVPIRFIAEATGANVEWNDVRRVVIISTN